MKNIIKYALIIFGVIFLLNACSSQVEENYPAYNEDGAYESNDYRNEPDFVFIEEGHAVYNGSFYVIQGIVQNNTDKDFSYVDIFYNLLDANGNIIGTAYANANHIGAGQNWKFEAMILQDGVASFEFVEVNGY